MSWMLKLSEASLYMRISSMQIVCDGPCAATALLTHTVHMNGSIGSAYVMDSARV